MSVLTDGVQKVGQLCSNFYTAVN